MLVKSVEVRVLQQPQSHSFFLPSLLLTSENRSINIKILKTDEITGWQFHNGRYKLIFSVIEIGYRMSIVKDFLR